LRRRIKMRISSKISPLELIEMKKRHRPIASIPADGRWIAVVRIRGTVNIRKDVADTLKLLRLHKPHHAVVIPLTSSYKGMLQKAQTTIAWGEINFETFLELLKKRGRVIGNRRLTDELVRELSKGEFSSIEELAKALWERKVSFKDLPWLKPVFRLHPPRGGYRGSIKKSYQIGGSWGYWGENINLLLERMM